MYPERDIPSICRGGGGKVIFSVRKAYFSLARQLTPLEMKLQIMHTSEHLEQAHQHEELHRSRRNVQDSQHGKHVQILMEQHGFPPPPAAAETKV